MCSYLSDTYIGGIIIILLLLYCYYYNIMSIYLFIYRISNISKVFKDKETTVKAIDGE